MVCATLQELPLYDERRALLARDPLACAEGFRTLVMLTLRHLFGVRYCPDCPNCARSDRPCMDAFGSNATAKGGIFGRIDAIYGAIECQKSGSLHLHTQAFVQCYHQFRPLSELVTLSNERQLELLRRYSTYSAHVRRTIYDRPQDWEKEQEDVEADWPEYKSCNLMVSRPTYQSADAAAMTAEEWKMAYLTQDVEELQKRKQHHVHLPTGPKGERQPLNHCKDSKDPTKCKGGFPPQRVAHGRTASDLPTPGRRHGHAPVWKADHGGHALGTMQQRKPQWKSSCNACSRALQWRCTAALSLSDHRSNTFSKLQRL